MGWNFWKTAIPRVPATSSAIHSKYSRTTVTIWTRLYGVASTGQPGQRIQTNIVGLGSGVLRSSLHTRRSISRNNNRYRHTGRYRLLFRGVPRQAVECGPYPRRSSLAWNIRTGWDGFDGSYVRTDVTSVEFMRRCTSTVSRRAYVFGQARDQSSPGSLGGDRWWWSTVARAPRCG